jgi:hypothetical protein
LLPRKKIFIIKRLACSLCFYFSGSALLCAQDSTLYNINDPRNPKCPCHKYQKIADEEYKNTLASATQQQPPAYAPGESLSNVSGQARTEQQSALAASSGSSITGRSKDGAVKNKREHFTKHKRKKRIRKHPLRSRILNVRSWGIWKYLADPSACYHWK